MSANPPLSRRDRRNRDRKPKLSQAWLPWLECAALLMWGLLFFKYWLTGKLFLLIHPNYISLTIGAGLFLVVLGAAKLGLLLFAKSKSPVSTPAPHTTLLPPLIGTGLLIAIALLGLIIEPRAFASQTALQRGVTDTLTLTRAKPQSFRASVRPEDRSIIDWIRTLNVYPEPDAYTGQKVKVQGFVIHPPQKDYTDQYLLISRFVITCCAADVYPVSLPVKLTQSRSAYKPDTWFEVEGEMMTETLGGRRQVVIQAKSLKSIPEPKNPYDY